MFSCISNMFVCWVTSSLRFPFSPPPNEDCKLSPPNIFAAHVQLFVITSSRLAINCPKDIIHPLLSVRCQRKKQPLPPILHMRARIFGTSNFLLVVLNYNKSPGRSKPVCFLIHLFIYCLNFNFLCADVVSEFELQSRYYVLFQADPIPPPARAGYDTRSIFKRSLTRLNSEFFLLLD